MATLQDYLGITKLRDAWPKWKANVIAVNNQVINHVAGTADKHAAQDITYTGDFVGKTEVKAALDQAKTEIDTIVVNASVDPEVALARASTVKGETFDTLDARLEEDEQDLVSYKAESAAYLAELGVAKYGIRYKISTDTIARIGASVGKVASIGGGLNDFNSIMPWAGMRRCNLSDDFKVNAYYGDTNYIEDGSNGQVMTEIPAFYYSRQQVDSDTIDMYFSPTPLQGMKSHPWFFDVNGLPLEKRYYSAYEGSLFDVSVIETEVDTLTVTAPCSVSGNITIKLDQYNTFTIALLDTDNTTDLVATKIRNAVYTGWTTSGTTSTVIFTCNTSGAKTTAIFEAGTTGVTADIVKTTTGAGGYVTGDAQVADFTATTGDKLSSVAGVKPCSGLTQDLTLPMSRILAKNRGTKWEQEFFNAVSAIQMLLTVEYASLNSQSAIGQGVVNLPNGTKNESVVTGATSSLGNKSGRVVGTNGQVSVSYRGVENFWGNIYKWVDGLNIQNGFAFISNINGNFVSDTFTGQYIKVGELAHTTGYMSKALLSYNFDHGYLPAEVLGTTSSKYADYYVQNDVGAFVARLGGRWLDGESAGAFFWALDFGSSFHYLDIGARLCC